MTKCRSKAQRKAFTLQNLNEGKRRRVVGVGGDGLVTAEHRSIDRLHASLG